jgi:hypothetical protein
VKSAIDFIFILATDSRKRVDRGSVVFELGFYCLCLYLLQSI